MAAKFGVQHSARRMLGYHSASKDKSLLVYSRDSQAKPLRELEKMLRAIKRKQFVPDSTRSGYFPARAEGLPEGADPDNEDSDGESTSSEGSDLIGGNLTYVTN